MSSQVIQIYNRYPETQSYQWDQRSYSIPGHSTDHVTLEMAFAAIGQSVIVMDYQTPDDAIHGIVPEGDEMFGVPLSQEEINEMQAIPGWEIGVEDPENYHVVKLKGGGPLVRSQRRQGANVQVIAGEEGSF